MVKARFNTFDVVCMVTELRKKCVGLRLNNVFDINNKTYLLRFQEKEHKVVLVLESGIRMHTTNFEWAKNMAPSGFTMKLRKHLKNKRLEAITQLGIDRIVDLQFGMGEAAYHIILELYDRGNIVLADHEYTIQQILRYHTDGEENKFAIREKYPLHLAKPDNGPPSAEKIRETIANFRGEDSLRYALNPILEYGTSLIDHVLIKYGLDEFYVKGSNSEEVAKKSKKKKGKSGQKEFNLEENFTSLMNAVCEAETILRQGMTEISKGFMVQKVETKTNLKGDAEDKIYQNLEYQPLLYNQFKNDTIKEFPSFDACVDEFYSSLEAQKIDLKAFQTEKEALKKLSNVKDDHAKRLEELSKTQVVDAKKAELITRNQELVDRAINAIRLALANQMSWEDIEHDYLKEAKAAEDPAALAIKKLKLQINHITMELKDPYDEDSEEETLKPQLIDIDLGLSAFANARKYYDQKRTAAKKEQKTVDASEKAMKNAERRTQSALKEIRTISKIAKARKTYWFEKFFWFISSENYLIIGGRDAQQNELIVKRYMRQTDYYVHAEIQGASSVVIKNHNPGSDVPPKTLLEAGTMAISYSVAWDAKVATNCYWVKGDQVSKTAPTGEYLATGSFMIRGKRNALPPCHLILGLSMLFKLEDGSIERHKNDRKVRGLDEMSEVSSVADLDVEIEVDNASGDEDETPDTEVKVKHDVDDADDDDEEDHGTVVKIRHDSEMSAVSDLVKGIEIEEPNNLIIAAAPTRIKQQPKKKQKEKQKEQQRLQKQQQQQPANINPSQLKRGQKSKLKKIKEKYGDQDEEERELRMQILMSAGHKKPEKTPEEDEEEAKKSKKPVNKPQKQPEEELLDDTPAAAETDMIDSLTGQPVDEDELLFAIPVVAPYQALQNYKFKVKLTPGPGKRGRAAKTALQVFLKEKSCSNHEKDLLKAIKDDLLARNIPGKVKLSAPQLQKFKK